MWGRKDDQPDSAPSSSGSTSESSGARSPVRATPVASTPATAASANTPDRGRGQALIGKSLKVTGTITGREDLYVDGEIEGTVELEENSLTIGPNGKVSADVKARDITVLGQLDGNVHAGDRVDIRKTGSLEGDLTTSRIVIEDGAVFRGSIDIAKPDLAAPASSARKPAPAAAAKSSDNGGKGSKNRDDSKDGGE